MQARRASPQPSWLHFSTPWRLFTYMCRRALLILRHCRSTSTRSPRVRALHRQQALQSDVCVAVDVASFFIRLLVYRLFILVILLHCTVLLALAIVARSVSSWLTHARRATYARSHGSITAASSIRIAAAFSVSCRPCGDNVGRSAFVGIVIVVSQLVVVHQRTRIRGLPLCATCGLKKAEGLSATI